MMGHRQVDQAALFYEFSLDRHIPANHVVRWDSGLCVNIRSDYITLRDRDSSARRRSSRSESFWCRLRRGVPGRRESAPEANSESIFVLVVADVNALWRLTFGGRIENPFNVF